VPTFDCLRTLSPCLILSIESCVCAAGVALSSMVISIATFLLSSGFKNEASGETFVLSRRSFLAGTISLGTASRLCAETDDGTPTVLRLERRDIEVNSKSASVFCIRQPDGTFGITTNVDRPFRVRVENHIEQPSLIHWHGLTPPWQQDGAPEAFGAAIPPGGSADYNFPLRRSGTYWMHSHYGLQEQLLLSAPLSIRDGGESTSHQEVVVMLADFSFCPSDQTLAQLRSNHTHDIDMHGAGMPGVLCMGGR
jgi:FtsP/CotA-like multicopper oxidase with cupredoxin domain